MAESVQIKSMRPRHEAIIDWLLANPGARSLVPLCAELGITRSWLSIVMNSDVFKEAYAERRMAHNAELSKQLVEKQLKVTMKALDRVDELLDDEDEYDLRTSLDVADRLSKNLGFHPSPGMAPMLEERTREFRTVSRGTLQEARETIKRITHVQHSTD